MREYPDVRELVEKKPEVTGLIAKRGDLGGEVNVKTPFETVEPGEKVQNYPKKYLKNVETNWAKICQLMEWSDVEFSVFKIAKNPRGLLIQVQERIQNDGGDLRRFGADGWFGEVTVRALESLDLNEEKNDEKEETFSLEPEIKNLVWQNMSEAIEIVDNDILPDNFQLYRNKMIEKYPDFIPFINSYDNMFGKYWEKLKKKDFSEFKSLKDLQAFYSEIGSIEVEELKLDKKLDKKYLTNPEIMAFTLSYTLETERVIADKFVEAKAKGWDVDFSSPEWLSFEIKPVEYEDVWDI